MRHVAIFVETSRAYGRGLLRGIARYNTAHGNWSTYFQPQGLGDTFPSWLADWRGDGILARIVTPRQAEAVAATGLPVVNLRGSAQHQGFPFIGSDNRVVAQLAAEHLLARGLKHFAYCGFPAGGHPGFDLRGEAFTKLIQEAGFDCAVFSPSSRGTARGWDQEQIRLASWISKLPKPVGIMAVNDDRGMQVLDACRRSATSVPDEAAVLGVDNDEFLCSLSIPQLTSIDVHSEETGYLAAELLERLMNGQPAPKRLPVVAPRGVVVRRSTDVLAIDDEEVLRAVRFIRDHATEEIGVADVLNHVVTSRATFEPRFQQELRSSIHQEIVRVRVELAKQLLAETDLPIKLIAQRAGFKTQQYLTRVMRTACGVTPAQYRRQHGFSSRP